MVFCPTCKQAYPPGSKECPEHHAKLVAELPFQSIQGDNETWVEIGDIWSIKSDLKKSFVGNFMAMRGVLLMRFDGREGSAFLGSGLFSSGWRKSLQEERLRFQFRLGEER